MPLCQNNARPQNPQTFIRNFGMIDLKNDDDECDGKHFFKYDKYA